MDFTKDGEFKQVEATETKTNIEQYKDSYVDYPSRYLMKLFSYGTIFGQ